MKELTIEEKARQYDEAIKKAKEYYNKGRVPEFCNYIASDIFPELKQSEDERISEEIMTYLSTVDDKELIPYESWIAWIKKQVKQKPIERKEFTSIPFGAFDSELYEQMFTIPDGCVATIEGNRIHIKREYKTATEAIKEEKIDNSNKDEVSPWTLNDARDGDILISYDNKPFIYNGCFNDMSVGAHCGLNIYDEFTIANKQCNWTSNYNIRPATKKECQTLFNEMNLLGWTWNPETKELNRLDEDEQNNN